jgi:SAM-dependent methyltransferase
MTVDFGPAAEDYARYRTGFPPEFFTRLAALGVGSPGQRIADLGTGTGALARELAAAGCAVTGVDVAPELLDQARDLGTAAGVDVTYRVAPAEDTGLPGGQWDVVTAAQCWHWFDAPRAVAEVRRLLRPGGVVVLCSRDYVLDPGNVCEASERLILTHNPGWPMAGSPGTHDEWAAGLTGFTDLETFTFDVDVPYTHAAWRGRMRSSNGVAATLPADRVAAFDTDLARLLRDRFPDEPLRVPHRVFAMIATTPAR